jgi:hypothetical protein
VALESLFRRIPDLRLAVPKDEITWAPSFLRSLTGCRFCSDLRLAVTFRLDGVQPRDVS